MKPLCAEFESLALLEFSLFDLKLYAPRQWNDKILLTTDWRMETWLETKAYLLGTNTKKKNNTDTHTQKIPPKQNRNVRTVFETVMGDQTVRRKWGYYWSWSQINNWISLVITTWSSKDIPQNTCPQLVVVQNFVSARQTGHRLSVEYVTGGGSGSVGPSFAAVSLPSCTTPSLSRTRRTCSSCKGWMFLWPPWVLYRTLTNAMSPKVDARPISTSSPTPSTIVPCAWKRKFMKSNNNSKAIFSWHALLILIWDNTREVTWSTIISRGKLLECNSRRALMSLVI